jgi:hypothetical protein
MRRHREEGHGDGQETRNGASRPAVLSDSAPSGVARKFTARKRLPALIRLAPSRAPAATCAAESQRSRRRSAGGATPSVHRRLDPGVAPPADLRESMPDSHGGASGDAPCSL